MIPQKAIDLILDAEGIDQPSEWPGEESGVTIGYGYDLGYEKNFARDWDGLMPSGHIERLKAALGVTGLAAKMMARRYLDIEVQPAAARTVFLTKTLPHYEDETSRAFPGADKLPPLVFGALVSLVFNRGTGMIGPRREEMRNIREAIGIYADSNRTWSPVTLPYIANQFRAMKRLWVGKGVDGLLVRRENEAKLVEEAIAEASAQERTAIAS